MLVSDMTDTDRVKLLFGPYRTSRFRLGQVVTDEARDRDVVIVGISDDRIPWPIGQPKGSRARSLIVFDALAEAVRTKANQAVCHWWGITPQTVTKWRKALGVGRMTAGTTALKRDYFNEPWGKRARKKAHAKARDPVRRAKIAAARRGKPRPAHVVEGMRERMLGTKHSDETRRTMSDTHKQRGRARPRPARHGRGARINSCGHCRLPRSPHAQAGRLRRCTCGDGS